MDLEDSVAAVKTEVARMLALEGLDGLSEDAHLFEMGLDSLSAIVLMTRLRNVYGVQVSVQTLYENPTIGRLARLVHQSSQARQ